MAQQKEKKKKSHERDDWRHIHKADLRVPGALGDGLLEVGACEARARHEVDVLLGVEAHLLQKGHQLLLALFIPAGQRRTRASTPRTTTHRCVACTSVQTATTVDVSAWKCV